MKYTFIAIASLILVSCQKNRHHFTVYIDCDGDGNFEEVFEEKKRTRTQIFNEYYRCEHVQIN